MALNSVIVFLIALVGGVLSGFTIAYFVQEELKTGKKYLIAGVLILALVFVITNVYGYVTGDYVYSLASLFLAGIPLGSLFFSRMSHGPKRRSIARAHQ